MQVLTYQRTLKMPTWAINFIVNGDDTDLSESEANEIQVFLDAHPMADFLFKDESYFSHVPEFGLPGEVVDCDLYMFMDSQEEVEE
jgi:hypothetical protein